jgi:hypothetical protein
MGYYIPKSDVDKFDPDTYFDSPILDEKGLCSDEKCQQLGYCKLKRKKIKNTRLKIDVNQLALNFY